MQNKSNTNIERIIAKIDNDFNPDGSDWIPRVGPWVVDAMSQLDVTSTEEKTRKLPVNNRLAYSPCKLDDGNVEVYDANGCRVKEMNGSVTECDCSLRGVGNDEECNPREVVVDDDGNIRLEDGTIINAEDHRHLELDRDYNSDPYNIHDFEFKTGHRFTHRTVDHIRQHANHAPGMHALLINTKESRNRYNVVEVNEYGRGNEPHNYVISGGDKIQLNFDTPFITIKYEDVKTEYSEVYGCELPVIPNNGLLIEAIVYYCMYKMLCRGYTHPVMNLKASQYGTNPYYEWNKLKDEAKRKSIIDAQGNVIDDSDLWQSAFYIYTFCR